MQRAINTKPRQVNNFGLAFVFLSFSVIAVQLINYIITVTPAAQDAVLNVADGTTIAVSSKELVSDAGDYLAVGPADMVYLIRS